MSGPYNFVMDNKTYRLRVKFPDLTRSFRVQEGRNSGDMLDGSYELDSEGTYYDYEMSVEPHPLYPEDYDAFFWAISDPTGRHTILVPFGQTTMVLDVLVTSGADSYHGVMAGFRRWSGLKVQFRARVPQRRVSE